MSSPAGIPVFCGDCDHDQLVVGKVASSLRCEACGSTNLGLTGIDERTPKSSGLTAEAQSKLAAPKGYGTGWGKPHPDPLSGWNEYAGPTPQTYPRNPPVADTTTCPVCHGSGYDLIDKTQCRECGGTGTIVHPTGRPATLSEDATTSVEPAGGAGWRGASLGLTTEATSRVAGRPNKADPYGPEHQLLHSAPDYRSRVTPSIEFNPDNSDSFYPKAQERSPNIRTRKDRDYSEYRPYQMNTAGCPSCGHAPTELRKDKNEDAWWVCPSCGPLANIDANPDVNPYAPARDFQPNRNMKTSSRFGRTRKTGRLLAVLAAIHEANDLDAPEAVELARKTVRTYREGR